MTHMDDDAIAKALVLEHFIDNDLMDPQRSIIIELLASTRATAIEATKRLIEAPATDAKRILHLQAQVRRFSDLHRFIVAAQTRAGEAWNALPESERKQVIAFTQNTTGINDA
jgi:hypothetical protein